MGDRSCHGRLSPDAVGSISRVRKGNAAEVIEHQRSSVRRNVAGGDDRFVQLHRPQLKALPLDAFALECPNDARVKVDVLERRYDEYGACSA